MQLKHIKFCTDASLENYMTDTGRRFCETVGKKGCSETSLEQGEKDEEKFSL